ncbi:DUF2264 domain-containing protein [Saccharopolyspora mangrovi]|uniref:DUF2264 domain-containing protein n=1 Tax=Saccharopolyspora mangrovi TaxID=3082379 RepID=A0ABU6ABK7_9PSEU|nr:DUF2264 domain-containing protein [Saccharopolyspora sp. S2-29]MEB3368937.1 DUF2264 domain-containing protein [Saccharopolyspora sp. S2-29]
MTDPHERSQHTGWTRQHWAELADRMLAAVGRYRSPSGALIELPGPHSSHGAVSDGLEGFARTFLLAGFRIAGERGSDPGGVLERYAEGLAAGTDPASPERWPRPDELHQAKVEAASIALVLQLTRPWLWDRLDDGVRERVIDWLTAVIGQPYPPINWIWFRITVESFLREAGGPFSAADIEEDLAVHASLRRQGGWLSDGPERAFDHYVGWALHVYPLLWTHLFDVTGSLCPESVRATWQADLADYLDDAVHLIGADGSPLMQGRSLIYRFAAAAPFWVGAMTGTGGVPPGLTRRVASGMLSHFDRHGALGEDGLLSIGWHRPWPEMRQSYSGPGSPYWASKGMLGLALPADHPVWTDAELPLPAESGDRARAIAAPGWLAATREDTGIAFVLNHGTDHATPGDERSDSPLYARLGYSTATMSPLTGPTVEDPVDNAVVLVDAQGGATHRTGFATSRTRELPNGALMATSSGLVRWVDSTNDTSPDHGSGRTGQVRPGTEITIASVLRDGLEVRLVRVENPPGEGVSLRLGGWPVAADSRPAATSGGADGAPHAQARTAELRSHLRGLSGFTTSGTAAERGTSPLGDWTVIPWLSVDPVPAGEVLAALVVLDRGDQLPAHPSVEVRLCGEGRHAVVVTWPDQVRTEIDL